MEHSFSRISIVSILLVLGICQRNNARPDKSVDSHQKHLVKKCPPNPEILYDRQKVLKQLANILNGSVPEYREIDSQGFYVKNERGVSFFLHDLTDVSNKDTLLKDCINFYNHHIYHFAPIAQHYSLSHIVILENGSLKVFKSINCKDRGDSLEAVINYLSQKLVNDKDKDEIINRVRNYRKYGIYHRVDDSSLICEEADGNKK